MERKRAERQAEEEFVCAYSLHDACTGAADETGGEEDEGDCLVELHFCLLWKVGLDWS